MKAQRNLMDRPSIRPMRRRDRAEDESWIGDFLRRAPSGVLAVADSGPPILNANLFVYEPTSHEIWLHTARYGQLPDLLAESRPCSFSAFELGRMVAADRAMNFSCEYASVIAFGTCAVEADPDRAAAALQLMMNKYAAHLQVGVDYDGVTPADLKQTAVYRMRITSWSGKRKELPADEPHTYVLPDEPEFRVRPAGRNWISILAKAYGGEAAARTR